MKQKGSVKMNGQVVSKWESNIGSGHVDYSGFGVHGKHKRAKNRADRRERKLEEKRTRQGRDW
jgi:hypothetical protein